ncbi:MAG: CatB-related O-acetyltransferase [Pararhodobacter sp.]|nr:CatB-related O-acetyltransferase [Pararhodobacter sp.]
MTAPFLSAAARHPMRFPDGRENPCMVHLNRAIDHPNFDIGDFTYANDFDPPQDWAGHLAPYIYHGAPERLVIGRFGQIAHGVRFITASANHAMGGISTYPFPIFNPATLPLYADSFADLPDTVIGHDVWIGHGALILPGAQVGHGAIIGAGAVVAGKVPDYAVMAGNPARVVRQRFSAEAVARLLALGWWDWPLERIAEALPQILAGDVEALCHAGSR